MIRLKKILEDIEVLGQTEIIPLDKIPTDVAKIIVKNGQKDTSPFDDVAMFKKAAIPVKDLKPAQTEIIKEKAFALAIKALLENKIDNADLGAIISKDNYIMDGHHRWAAMFLINPNSKVTGTVINLPGKALLSVLNIITKAMGKEGNPGEGDIRTFVGSKFDPIITDALANGVQGDFPIPAEKVNEAMKRVPGANGDVNKAKQIMMKNADLLPKQIIPGAPDRVNMPVIDGNEVAKVAAVIKSGVIDFTKPYSKGTDIPQSVSEMLQEILKK